MASYSGTLSLDDFCTRLASGDLRYVTQMSLTIALSRTGNLVDAKTLTIPLDAMIFGNSNRTPEDVAAMLTNECYRGFAEAFGEFPITDASWLPTFDVVNTGGFNVLRVTSTSAIGFDLRPKGINSQSGIADVSLAIDLGLPAGMGFPVQNANIETDILIDWLHGTNGDIRVVLVPAAGATMEIIDTDNPAAFIDQEFNEYKTCLAEPIGMSPFDFIHRQLAG